VEGAEVQALRGMRRLLRDAGPVVICETHGTWDAVCEELADAGYEIQSLERGRGGRAAWNPHLLARPKLTSADGD
jgi:hypothetical protein